METKEEKWKKKKGNKKKFVFFEAKG